MANTCPDTVLVCIIYSSDVIHDINYNTNTNIYAKFGSVAHPSPFTLAGGDDGVMFIGDFGYPASSVILPNFQLPYDVYGLPRYLINTDDFDISPTPQTTPQDVWFGSSGNSLSISDYVNSIVGEEVYCLVFSCCRSGATLYNPQPGYPTLGSDAGDRRGWTIGYRCLTCAAETTTPQPGGGTDTGTGGTDTGTGGTDTGCSPCFPYVPTTPSVNPPFTLDNSIWIDNGDITLGISPRKYKFGNISTTTTTPTTTQFPQTTPSPNIIPTPPPTIGVCGGLCKTLKF